MSDDRLDMIAALKAAFGGEALFRPSSIGRIMACKGSVQLCARARQAGYKRFSSKYALEGSAAHVVAEQALKGIRQPGEWTDRMVRLDDGGLYGQFVDEEMADSVEDYLDDVRSSVEPGDELLVEHYMSLAALDPTDAMISENRGTGDAIILQRIKRRVKLRDLKYGKGVPVAGDAPQLRNYAILAVLNFDNSANGGWDEVEVGVNQPRLPNERDRRKVFTFAVVDLMSDFLGRLMQSMHDALGPEPELTPGLHCRWCDAKGAGICPAIQDEAVHIGRDDFAAKARFTAASSMGAVLDVVHLATPEAPLPARRTERTVVLPAAVSLSAADIATVLDRRHLWDTWIQSVEERACALIEAGVVVPGWMIAARSGNRRWKGEESETEAALRAIGLKTIEIYPTTPKLLSPAQVEKLLKKDKKDLIEPLVKRPPGKSTLMRATGSRTPIASGMGPIET